LDDVGSTAEPLRTILSFPWVSVTHNKAGWTHSLHRGACDIVWDEATGKASLKKDELPD
jgi:hypothetical protein